MNRVHAAALLLSVFPVAAEAPFEAVPTRGDSYVLAWSTRTEASGGDLEVTMGGSPIPSTYLPDLEIRSVSTLDARVTETWLDDGSSWLRRYDEIEHLREGDVIQDGAGEPWSHDVVARAEERLVRFSRDGDDLEREFADDGAEEDFLDELEPALGLRALLPDEPVEVGGSWTVAGEDLALLWFPLGDAGWIVDEYTVSLLGFDITREEHAGELELVLEELDGALATCRLTGELERASQRPGDLTPVPVVSGAATDYIDESWELEGELVWDVELGRIVSLELEGEYDSVVVTEKDAGEPGPSYESSVHLTGTHRVEVTSEPSDEVLSPSDRD